MIDPATLQALPRLLSAARFDRYAARYDGRTDLAARLYAWNSEIASAFWGPVGCLEVFVRNALHDELRRGRRDDWWNDSAVHLLDRERRAVDDATRTLRRRGFTDPEPDQVVAATSFGFWVGLTDAGIPRDPIWSYETTLWQPRLVHAFPGLGGGPTQAAAPATRCRAEIPEPARPPRTDPQCAVAGHPRRHRRDRRGDRPRRSNVHHRCAPYRRRPGSEAGGGVDRRLGDLTDTTRSHESLGSVHG